LNEAATSGVRKHDLAPAAQLTQEVFACYSEAARQVLAAPEGRNSTGKIRLQLDS
jgi:hypothetical protein